VHDVVSGQRDEIMSIITAKADQDARQIGVQVVDVRLKRVDLSEEISDSVYRRMDAERKRVANELRSTGAAEAEKIKADADRQKQVIIAEAYKDAQRIKGEGDAKAAAIYAQAYGKNPEFYSFYRSMQAYKDSFKNKSDVMVLDPSSDFFKYMQNPRAGGTK
jgi:membrane protease subunit HflC